MKLLLRSIVLGGLHCNDGELYIIDADVRRVPGADPKTLHEDHSLSGVLS